MPNIRRRRDGGDTSGMGGPRAEHDGSAGGGHADRLGSLKSSLASRDLSAEEEAAARASLDDLQRKQAMLAIGGTEARLASLNDEEVTTPLCTTSCDPSRC